MMGLRSVSLLLLLLASVAAHCPSGTLYESDFKKCYNVFNTPQTFTSAEQTCNSIGGHLVSIQNAFENSYVSGLATGAAAGMPTFWIGANLFLTNSWSWTDNSSMIYTNWAIGQPIASNPCGTLRDSDFSWITGACNSTLPFICAVDPNSPLPTSPSTCATDAVCTSGYTLFTGNCMCYKYFTDHKNFAEANGTCAQNGGFLASSTSAEVNDFLTTLPGINCVGYTCPYIGLFCTSSSMSSCKWADGSSLGNYTHFYNGVPENSPYNYVMVSGSDSDRYYNIGRWKPQNNPRAYICQKAPTKASILIQTPSEKKKEQRKERMDV